MSGMWGVDTALERFLKQEGIRTLFFVSGTFLLSRILAWLAAL